MKKILVCALAVAALLCVCVSALALGGADFKLTGYVEGTLLYDAKSIGPMEGPGEFYHHVTLNRNLPKGSKVKVYSQLYDDTDMTWILVEANGQWFYLLQDDGAGTVFVRCNMKKVPKEAPQAIDSWLCTCYETQYLRSGPGTKYALTGFAMARWENAWVVLVKGDWALVECTNAYDDGVSYYNVYVRRGWVPFSELMY
ncbi:MAG: hypothetical protein IJ189_11165 [Clostridia bacterium]|nr:hypothetical protein [Clostridia bacterium]